MAHRTVLLRPTHSARIVGVLTTASRGKRPSLHYPKENIVESIEQSAAREEPSFALGEGRGGRAGAIVAARGLADPSSASASGQITKGDVAILQFLAAAELVEADLWEQYNGLAGIQDSELRRAGNRAYRRALSGLDDDMPQYIHDNADDKRSHANFINAYLAANGADPINLEKFRALPSSKVSGARRIGRLTNLTKLTIDTSWWTRYRSDC